MNTIHPVHQEEFQQTVLLDNNRMWMDLGGGGGGNTRNLNETKGSNRNANKNETKIGKYFVLLINFQR